MGITGKILDILYPPKCVFCGKILEKGEVGTCGVCPGTLPETEGTRARSTGEFFSVCVSPFYYGGAVRESIIRFKFGGRSGYAKTYARFMAECVKENIRDKLDLVTWVPVSAKRLRKRGYDQSELIAKALAEILGIECAPALVKIKDNLVQSNIEGAEKRRANVLGVYQIKSAELVEGKNVLLVDDVFTTGATLSESSRTLLMAGAARVFCTTLAKAH